MFVFIFLRFDDLENGNYPSLQELGEYRNQGFNFGQYFSQSLIDRNQYMQNANSRVFKVKSHSLVDESTILQSPVEQVQSEDELFDDFDVNEYELLSYEDGSTTEAGTAEKSSPRNDEEVVVERKPETVTEVKKQKRVRFSDLESISTFSDLDYINVPLLNGGVG